MIKALLATALGLSLSVGSFAKDLGVIGDIWPIQEKSLLTLLESRAATLNQESLKKKWQQRVRDYADRPYALSLERTDKSTQHTYEPVVNVTQDIVALNGQVIAKAGTSINALSRLPFYKPQLLFIDGDDSAQVAWAKAKIKQFSNAKLILTAGSIRDAEEAFDRPIYFDQKGMITGKFAISHVPAHAYREGLSIVIDELAIKENGDEA